MGRPQVRTFPFSAHLPSILEPLTYRISGFGSSGLLAHGSSLTKVHLRLGRGFDYSFLQIPHWPRRPYMSAVAELRFGFFGHPCFRLHIPSYRGYG
jgi:hypothetical protein